MSNPDYHTLPLLELPLTYRRLLWSAVVLGAVSFLASLSFGEAQRAWQIYYVNFVLWTVIAQGGIAFSAVYRITNGRWGEPFRRAGEAMVRFLPVSFGLFLVVFIGRANIFPWLHEPTGKEAWLNTPFFFARDSIIFLAMMWLSFTYVRISLRPELGAARDRIPERFRIYASRITKGWKGEAEERLESSAKLSKLSPPLLIAFVVLYSFLGFDLLMSLDPHWYSTLYGWLFFIHGFYGALVVIVLASAAARRIFRLHSGYSETQFHDMGKLVMGFCMLSGGFYWSQYLVIWYGNLPEETPHLITRLGNPTWSTLTWYYIVVAFFLPLAIFLSKRAKKSPLILGTICLFILSSLFVERYLAVVPDVWKGEGVPFGPIEVFISIGFAAAFFLSWFKAIELVPLAPPNPG